MPIGGPSTYLAVIDEVLAHWTLVNSSLSSPLTLSGGYVRSNLNSNRNTMNTKIAAANTALSSNWQS